MLRDPPPLFLVPHLTSEAESSRTDSQIVQHGRCCRCCGRRPGPEGQRGQNLVAGEVTLGRDTTHWPLSPRTGPHHLCCKAQFLFRCFCCLPVATELIDSTVDFNTTESWKVPTFVIHCRGSLLFKVRGSGTWREANETVLCVQSLPHRGSWAELREEPRHRHFVYATVTESPSNHAGCLQELSYTVPTCFLLICKGKLQQFIVEFTKLDTGQKSSLRTHTTPLHNHKPSK